MLVVVMLNRPVAIKAEGDRVADVIRAARGLWFDMVDVNIDAAVFFA